MNRETKRDPEGTRRSIPEAATQQFSTYGLSGARVDAIPTAADINERMLYYYFESKEGLYVAQSGITSARTRWLNLINNENLHEGGRAGQPPGLDALDFYVTLAAMGILPESVRRTGRH